MASKVEGIAIGVFTIVIVVLLYLAIVGQIVFSYQIYFSFWERVAFVVFALLIIFLLYFSSKEM